jgi:hypothetical protein
VGVKTNSELGAVWRGSLIDLGFEISFEVRIDFAKEHQGWINHRK